MTKIVLNPSLTTYKHLQDLYSSTLKCPCSNVSIPYSNFISLSATLHQVCSSDFISELWNLMIAILNLPGVKYSGLSAPHFQLLSSLCQLINKTIDDAIHRFTMSSLVTLNVLTESNFNDDLNAAFNQFNTTLVVNFCLLINLTNLFIHVDQPFAMSNTSNLPFNVVANESDSEQLPRVRCHAKD
jgi:hypothetical protein